MSRGSKAKTTIELNGKLYDARSGKVISNEPTSPAPAKAVTANAPKPKQPVNRTSGTVVDGFVKKSVAQASSHTQPKPTPKIARNGPSHAVTTLEKSKTLMRPAVKKPKPIVKLDISHNRHSSLKKQKPERALRAQSAEKSSLVQRFNSSPSHKVVKKEAALPVVAQKAHVSQQLTDKVASLATSTETRVHESVDIIEQSLRNASSHLEKFEGRVAKTGFWSKIGFKSKVANVACASFAVVLLLGFFAYQNTPSIEMRIAATRSDVSAHLPKYRPAGFSTEKNIKSEPGKVSVSFRSNTDDRKFTLTQQASNWSSDSLLSNHVLATKQPYQTYQQSGKTVYIYDNSNATWVNRGVWYKVDGNASLTSDQLLRIANSL